jgi:Cu+-exporting ATPase
MTQAEDEVVLDVQGMTCANCSQTIESFLSGEKGIKSVSVNFGTESAKIQYDPNVLGVRDIINLVEEVYFGRLAVETPNQD